MKFNQKHIDEASKAGLTLIGKGKNSHYRLYQFNECQHEQEIQVSSVRSGNFKCNECQQLKLEQEAVDKGLTIIGKGKTVQYRLYKFNDCGHEQEIQVGAVRSGKFKCDECQQLKIEQEATEHDLAIIGKGKNREYRLYKFNDCGHEQEITVSNVRIGNFKCNECQQLKIEQEASNNGLTIIGKGKNTENRLYKFNGCGHEREIAVSAVRSGKFKCDECQQLKIEQEASNNGLTIIGKGKNAHHRLYKFNDCGHEHEIRVGDVRSGYFKCKICETSGGYDNTKQGLFYLVRWTHPETHQSVLKFGITNHVDYLKRIAQQARKTEYNPVELAVRYYIDGSLPQELERQVHNNLTTGVISKELFGDGYTETVLDTPENIQFIIDLM